MDNTNSEKEPALTNDNRKIIDPINVQDLINFLEYEEVYTNDKETAWRIRNLLIKLKIWEQ
jgi:hypothetical protein